MKQMDREQLKELLANERGVCLSMYLPTTRGPAEKKKDQIAFKNKVKQAIILLQEAGLKAQEAEAVVGPAQSLLTDILHRDYNEEGLAVFISKNFISYYPLPAGFDELAVGRHFYIKPLIYLLSGDIKFYVLALSQNKVKVLDCSRFNCLELEPVGLPASLDEAMGYDLNESRLMFHTQAAGSGGTRLMFHGQGGEKETAKDEILRYFRQVNDGLNGLLTDRDRPLILAGVDYLFPIYQEANTYPNFFPDFIPGNPDRQPDSELHNKAWSLLKPSFEASQKEALAKYEKLAGTGKTSDRIEEILPAAYHGRVESLMVAVDRIMWGEFDPENSRVAVHEERQPDDYYLLDLTTVHTLLNGGDIYLMEARDMPKEMSALAVFRYQTDFAAVGSDALAPCLSRVEAEG